MIWYCRVLVFCFAAFPLSAFSSALFSFLFPLFGNFLLLLQAQTQTTMVCTENHTVLPLPVHHVDNRANTEDGCIYHHTTLPLFYYAVENKTNTENGNNCGYTYSFNYGNAYTSTVTENLTSDYCVDSTCSDTLLIYTDPTGKGSGTDDDPFIIPEVVITANRIYKNKETVFYILPIGSGYSGLNDNVPFIPDYGGDKSAKPDKPNGGGGGGGAPQIITGLNNANAYNSVATTIITPAANAGIQASYQVLQNTRNAALIARETQALSVLKPIAAVGKGAGIAGVGISTGIAGYLVLGTDNATTMDKVDFGVGLGALGTATGAFLLGSNPVGWAIIGGAGIYYTGRMVYDWLY